MDFVAYALVQGQVLVHVVCYPISLYFRFLSFQLKLDKVGLRLNCCYCQFVQTSHFCVKKKCVSYVVIFINPP